VGTLASPALRSLLDHRWAVALFVVLPVGALWPEEAARRKDVAVFSVVNHITLSEPLDDEMVERMQSELMAEAAGIEGFSAAYCTQPADDQIVIVLLTRTAEAMKAVHDMVESPWVTRNLGPHIASADRKPGPVIAHT